MEKHNLQPQPKRLFLIDSAGALLTAFMLAGVLAQFPDFFGMPPGVLYILSGIALVFAVYSGACFFLLSGRWQPWLKAIAIANTLYCVLTASLALYYLERLSFWALLYFLLEMVVIGILVRIEWRFSR